MSLVNKLLENIQEAVITSGEKVRASIAAGFTETTDALRLRGSRYVPLPAGGTSATAWRGPCRLVGWSIRESAGTPSPATVTLYDGRTADDPFSVVAVLELAANESSNLGLPSVSVTEGLFVVVTGSVAGALYLDTGPA